LRWIFELAELPRGVWSGEPIAWLYENVNNDSYSRMRWTAQDMRDSATVGVDRGARRLERLGRIRLLAAHAIGVHPDTIRLERRQNRGLRIVAPERIYVSDSGREALGAVAISDGPVGIDVEEFPPEGPLPVDLLHAEERDFLDAVEPSMRDRVFLRFWTAREAYLKAIEQGLAESLSVICARNRDPGTVELKREGIGIAHVQTIERQNCVAALATPDFGDINL
jgi:phosphopantetheinyl transferase